MDPGPKAGKSGRAQDLSVLRDLGESRDLDQCAQGSEGVCSGI